MLQPTFYISLSLFLSITRRVFDRVTLKQVLNPVLYNREVPLNIIRRFENIYVNNIIDGGIDGQLTEPINLETGITQGDLLSPLLSI